MTFKNVGQGDSIFFEWQDNSQDHYGIIDCNTHNNSNPLLDEIISKKVKSIDFIILSHLHHDHYSGMPELLRYCIDNKITIKLFLHTFTTDIAKILMQVFMSQKVQKDTDALLATIMEARKKKIIADFDSITHNFRHIALNAAMYLKFVAPVGDDYLNLSKHRAQYEAKSVSSPPDFNTMSTIVEITNDKESIILTADAPRKTFKRITGVLKNHLLLVQAPHHGSKYNLYEKFWQALSKSTNCPAVFSVGDVPKDKLPDKEVVQFFEANGYFNSATNFVYGIADHYSTSGLVLSPKASQTRKTLAHFSKSRRLINPSNPIPVRFSGDKSFQFNL